jgi:hypothetical protein
MKNVQRIKKNNLLILLLGVILLVSCKSISDISPLGPADQTKEAGEIVKSANEDLQKIKVLYEANENMRLELKQALETNNADQVRDISERVVKLIADGTSFAKQALSKIHEASELNINESYQEYLRLKEESLKRQLEAFEHYRLAAESLKANYDPKNEEKRNKVKAEFKDRSERYAAIMEKARSYSYQANELYKDVMQGKTE